MKLAEMLSIGGAEKSYDGRMGYFNTLVRRRMFEMMDSLGIIMPGESVAEPLKRQNLLLLAPGAHGGNIFKKPDTELHALAPGAVVTRPLFIEDDAVIDGVIFSAAAGTGPLVTVSGGTTVFRGCTFEKPEDDTASQVSVTSGPKAILLGCIFRGSGTTASRVVDHPAGAATDVQVAFCYNKTGNTLGNAADITMTGNL
jgi:hypothetical protein